MKTTQSWGWLTAGVLALGLNGFYHDGGAAWVHRIADQVAGRSMAVVTLASGRADEFLTRARLVSSREETASCRLTTALARLQTRLAETQLARTQAGMAQIEVMSAREEAGLARLEASRARIEAQTVRLPFAMAAFNPVAFNSSNLRVVCPRVRVAVPRPPMIKMPRVVHVERLGAGPV